MWELLSLGYMEDIGDLQCVLGAISSAFIENELTVALAHREFHCSTLSDSIFSTSSINKTFDPFQFQAKNLQNILY